jgi:hypothetical protein
MRKVLIGVLTVGAAFGLWQALRRVGHKTCEHRGERPCSCGHDR